LLSGKQAIAAALIGQGMANKEVAEKIGVCPQTISSWMSIPEFEKAIHAHRRELMKDLRNELRGSLTEAVRYLNHVLKNGPDEKTRFQAAKFLIEKPNLIPDQIGLYRLLTVFFLKGHLLFCNNINQLKYKQDLCLKYDN